MADLRENYLIYLAALLSLSTIALSVILDVQGGGPIRYLAPVFGVSGLCLALLPFSTLRRYGEASPGESYMMTTTVADRGLYAVVRHPQYLGYMCLNVTFMLISPHWLIILLGSTAIMLLYLFALQEEKRLIKKFGEAYQEYMGRVPRFNIIWGLVRRVIMGGGDNHE
jgi:protein-S-isoprenylcysteine O-methyltransferase Ste14